MKAGRWEIYLGVFKYRTARVFFFVLAITSTTQGIQINEELTLEVELTLSIGLQTVVSGYKLFDS